MRTQAPAGFPHLLRFVGVLVAAGWLVLIIWANVTMATLQAHNVTPGLPFGVLAPEAGEIETQDFAWHLLFLRGVQERLVERPYVAAQQEALMRRMLPQSTGGMAHAYSPVALVLATPLLALTGQGPYLFYTVVCGISVVVLFAAFLRPRMDQRLQAYGFLVCAFSMCVADQLLIGQTALFTVPAVGALWWLLRRRESSVSWRDDLAIAVLFWVLCVKPNIALLPATLLLGERAWRPLGMAVLLLVATWIYAASHYGGWFTGPRDYAHLLNHYEDADFPPYLQRTMESPQGAGATAFWFALHRDAMLVATALLLGLRWRRHVSITVFFQAAVWIFLLLSPYAQSTELWILCLLTVEGSFFRTSAPWSIAARLILLALILNLRIDTTPFRWLLFAWMAGNGVWPAYFRSKNGESLPPGETAV